jgi:transcriptional regulator with XRE-family HTH domain
MASQSQVMAGARDEVLIQSFAAVLRQARLGAGLSQEELAFRADVNRTFIGLLEAGKRQPTLCVLFALARAVNATPDSLIASVQSHAADRG